MKKTYIIPATKTHAIQAVNMMALSTKSGAADNSTVLSKEDAWGDEEDW